MDTPWSVRFIAGMWKIALAAFVGFLITVLTLAVGREVYFAFQARPAPEIIGGAIHWIGSFQWLFDYQTLLTGAAAATGVIWQINQASKFQRASFESKRAAARATLPLTLSKICAVAKENANALRSLALDAHRRGGSLPRRYDFPTFEEFDATAISELKQMVESAEKAERPVLAALLGEIQVHSARLRGLGDERRRSGGIPAINLEIYLGDAAEIYARSSALFDFARGETDAISAQFSPRETKTTLHILGIYDEALKERLTRQINKGLSQISKF